MQDEGIISEGWKSPTQEPWPVPTEPKSSYETPDKFWKFVSDALEDLEMVEQDEQYEVNMGQWHTYVPDHRVENGICQVCFAGAMMAGRFDVPPDVTCSPTNKYIKSIRSQDALVALDELRDGPDSVAPALDTFYQSCVPAAAELAVIDTEEFNDKYTWYDNSPEQFKAWIRKIIAILKKHDV